MNVVVGDNSGLLKVVSLKTNGSIKRLGSQNASRGAIDCMAWAGLHNPEQEVAIGLRNMTVEVWDTLAGELTATIPVPSAATTDADIVMDKIVGLDVLRGASASVLDSAGGPQPTRTIVAATASGTVRLVPWYDAAQAATLKAARSDAKKEAIRQGLSATAAAEAAAAAAPFASSVEWRAGPNLTNCVVAPSLDVLATGGNEVNLSLWDLHTQERVYKVRNMRDDWLSMRVPNHDLAYAFIPSIENAPAKSSPADVTSASHQAWAGAQSYRVASVTAYKRIRLYDCKASERPVMDESTGKISCHSIAALRDGIHVVTGDGTGRVEIRDLRYNLRPVGILRGAQGSVRGLAQHRSLPMMASVGLDRHLRVHDLSTRRVLKATYLKQKLNCCLFSAVEPVRARSKGSEAEKDSAFDRRGNELIKRKRRDDDEDMDEVWGALDKASKENDERRSGKSSKAAGAVQDGDDDDEEEVKTSAEGEEGSDLDFTFHGGSGSDDDDDDDDDEEEVEEEEDEDVEIEYEEERPSMRSKRPQAPVSAAKGTKKPAPVAAASKGKGKGKK